LYEGSASFFTGDQHRDELGRKAAAIVRANHDQALVRKALNEKDRDLRLWAIYSFPFAYNDPAKTEWQPLLPKLMEVAAEDPDAGIRAEAIRRLRFYDHGRNYLDQLRRAEKETDPWTVAMLYDFDSERSEARSHFYERAVALLSSADEAVRLRWLS